jgi:hypothetical protein
LDLKFRVKSIAPLCLAALAFPACSAAAQKSDSPAAPSSTVASSTVVAVPVHPDVSAIVQDMTLHNRLRAAELAGYTDRRRYAVTYRGYNLVLRASMVVEATYTAPDYKSFRILSETGSKLLIDHVLKKLLVAEQEAARDPNEAQVDEANYDFTLLGMQNAGNRPCYVLRAEPKSNSRLLFRGRIWVDAKDFAVSKVEAEPARNPSFWIKDTRIHHVYGQTGSFWFPESDRSVTHVRLGGSAVLTIDYGTYHPVSRDPKP